MIDGQAIYAAIYQFLNFIISGLVVVVVIVMVLFFLRLKNARDVAPDTKTGEYKILVEFYPVHGKKYHELCRVIGNTVKSKRGGEYLLMSNCVWEDAWRPGQPSIVQVPVQCTAYYENISEPIVSRNRDEWIGNPDRKEITAYMQRTALNESTMRTMIAMQEKVWADIAQMAKFIKNVPYMFYGMIAMLGLLAICIYMLYTVMTQVSALRGLFG